MPACASFPGPGVDSALPASLSEACACTPPGSRFCQVLASPVVWRELLLLPVSMSELHSGSPNTNFHFNLCGRYWLKRQNTAPLPCCPETEENKLGPGRYFQNIPELANFNLETAFGYRHSGLRHISKYKEPCYWPGTGFCLVVLHGRWKK